MGSGDSHVLRRGGGSCGLYLLRCGALCCLPRSIDSGIIFNCSSQFKCGGGGVGDDELGYKLNDPKGVVAAVEFCSADGKVLETGGRMSSGGVGNKSYTISFRDKPPADAVAKIYLLTEKSLVKIPLNLSAVPLP